jgi:hypothetical protein
MKEGMQLRIPIESFVIHQTNEGDMDRVVYYDSNGVCHEKQVSRRLLEQALQLFDGKPRAIRRSTGGIITAQPYKLVLYHSRLEGSTPELTIKVRFRDFSPPSTPSDLVSGDCKVMAKNVPVHELLNPFPFTIDENQKYVLDFGRGIIPIHVFTIINDPAGEKMALFVEQEASPKKIVLKQTSSVQKKIF